MNGLQRLTLLRAMRRVLVMAVPAGMIACAPSPSQYTVEYYQAHEAEREAKLAQCANDPGALRNDALCINARQAGVIEGFGRWEDLPPIGLGKAEEKRRRERESEGERRPQ